MTQAGPATDDLPEDETPSVDTAPAAAGDSAALAAANAKIAELEKKLTEMRDQALRALAEADNTRKRMERERQDTARFAVSAFARGLLTVADNLRRALDAITPQARESSPELNNIYTGVEATERELLRLFEINSIRKILPLGLNFDPNLHEVIFEQEGSGKPPGTITQVMEPGYTIHERLLRPARVGIAKGDVTETGATVDKEV